MNTLAIKIHGKQPITEVELHKRIDYRPDGHLLLLAMFKAGYWWDKDQQVFIVK